MRISRPAAPALVGLIAALALALAACGPGAGPGGDPTTAATVNGEDIPVSVVEDRYRTVAANPQFAEQLEADEEGELERAVQARILTELIESTLIEQGASELGVQVDDADVEQRRAELVEEVGGQDAFDELVERSGLSEEDVTEQIRDITVREKVQEALGGDDDVTDEDVEAFYEQQREQRYERIAARHILVETEEEAQEALERLEAGEDFGEVAQEVSIDTTSGEQGGDLGEFGRGQMVPEFEEAAFDAEIGEVVGPVQSQFGFHIIEVTDRTSQELEEVAEDIRAELSQEQGVNAVTEWLEARRQEADITVNPRFGEWDPEVGEVVTGDDPLQLPGEQPPPEGAPQQEPPPVEDQ